MLINQDVCIMKKIIVIDAVDFYFPTVRAINAENGKVVKMEDVSDVNSVEETIMKVGGDKCRVVYITRENQDRLREKIRDNGFREGRIYNIHENWRMDDLSCNMKLIMDYDGVGMENMIFMSKKYKDLIEVKDMGITCYGFDGERWS